MKREGTKGDGLKDDHGGTNGGVTMRAALVGEFGSSGALRVGRTARPEPAVGEILVRVVTAGVQPADVAARSGWTPPGATTRLPLVPGNECAGVVAAVGPGVTGFAPGDPVIGFRVLGCHAEYVAIPETDAVRKPEQLPWQQAGALSASGQTAHTALERLRVAAGETVLVHGAAGGVGTMFVQLASGLGASVVGTASRANHDYLRSLGVTPVEYGPGQEERIRVAAPGGIDAVLDAAGRGSLLIATRLVADRARIGTIVDMQLAEELGCLTLRSDRSAARLTELLALTQAGALVVHVRRTYGLDEVVQAHRDVESGHGRGKVVLSMGAAA